MFFNNIRFQIVSCLVLMVLILSFIHSNRLKLRSIRLFTMLLLCTAVNLIADIATVYTITHMDTVPAWVNRGCHMLFIATLNTLLYGMFRYVSALYERGRSAHKLRHTLLMLPYIASLIMVLFGKLYYFNDGVQAYSYGPMVTALYSCVAFYMLCCNLVALKGRRTIRPATRYAIHSATLIWIFGAVLQSRNPGLLFSSVSVMLMMLYMFISLENPRVMIDPDTDCFNRQAMFLVLDEAFSAKKKPVVVNIVLEGLADINHQRGYSAAAEAIRALSEHAQALFSADVFRYRGTALALVVFTTPEEAYACAERILPRLAQPFATATGDVYLNCHIDTLPCALINCNSHEVFDTLDFLLEHRSGKSVPVRLITAEELAKKERMEQLEGMLAKAVKEDGFSVVYQPIFNTQTQSFTSAEALVRLTDTKTLGFVSPEEFIPIAERKGYINAIGGIVLKKVLSLSAREKLWEKGMQYIEVNLSGLQAADPDLVNDTRELLKQYDVPPAFINYEVTETAAVSSGKRLISNMQCLRDMGCSFSMDDFGTGYSNIAQMIDVSYDLIKLDKSLIWPCFGDNGQNPRVVLKNVVKMVSGIRTKLVAEGVETQEQVDFLSALGVHHLQGYHYSRPVPEDAFLAFLEEQRG